MNLNGNCRTCQSLVKVLSIFSASLSREIETLPPSHEVFIKSDQIKKMEVTSHKKIQAENI